MNRKAKIIRYSRDRSRAICIDIENWKEIFDYINESKQHKKKFNYIANIILENLRNTDVYDKEDINKKARRVTAMKFFKGGTNDRIYCKEVSREDKTFIVIAAELYRKKKSQKTTQNIAHIINKVAAYTYEIIE